MTEQIYKNIYKIHIPLPGNPLKLLNSYVIKAQGEGKNLLIDTGFNRPECFGPLIEGMEELGLCPDNTDVFITHLHSDHAGNAGALQKMGARIIMNRPDYYGICHVDWETRGQWYISEGMSREVTENVLANNPAILYRPLPFEADMVEDGEILEYGGFKLRCVQTPGHTMGHMCLYCVEEKILFSADHVLFDITPNICSMGGETNMLGAYLESLDRIGQLDISLTLPAHRGMGSEDVYQRIEGIKAHHKERIAETESIVRSQPNLTAYEIAGKMSWAIRTKSWEDFPPGQKWFAMGEALAHLDWLRAEGLVIRIVEDGVYHYKAL